MRHALVAAVALTLAACQSIPPAPTAATSPAPVHAQGLPSGTPVPGQYIVVLRDDVRDVPAVARSLVAAQGGGLQLVYEHAIKGFSARLSAQAAAALARNPSVSFVEQDQVVQAFAQTVPTGIKRIFADKNANIGIDGIDDKRVDVDVAIIDSGIDLDHPDLNVNVAGSRNCTGGNLFVGKCGSGGDDDNGHGTHVAGTVAALDNGIGVVGVAPGARLWAVKVLDSRGSGYMSWIVAGIDYVTEKYLDIEVANMSLGCECTSSAMDAAIEKSVAAGVVYVVAAGNSDKDATTFSPANHRDVITVSALADFDGLAGGGAASTCRADQDDTLADFSNWGPDVEIAAPGVCILSTIPGGYATYSGTSMASPHAAGAAALLASADGTLSPENIRTKLTGAGNFDWSDDSKEYPKVLEPLLDVRDAATFAPKFAAATAAGIKLTASGTKKRNIWSNTLSWIPGATMVDVYRNDAKVASNQPNPYEETLKGGDSHTYKVCETGATTVCSNEVTVQ